MGLHVVSCTPSGGIHSNPKTVAAMIRVNGLEDVRRDCRVQRSVFKQACDLIRDDMVKQCEREKAALKLQKIERLIDRVEWRGMRFARMHGVESLRAALARPYATRLLSALCDAWQEECGFAEIGRRHGWDLGKWIKGKKRETIRSMALGFGIDLEMVALQANPAEMHTNHSAVLLRISASKRVMARACRLFGVTTQELCGPSRVRNLTTARFFYCHWVRRLGGMSYPEIGRRIGGRDHTTVLNADLKWPEKRDAARGFVQGKWGRRHDI